MWFLFPVIFGYLAATPTAFIRRQQKCVQICVYISLFVFFLQIPCFLLPSCWCCRFFVTMSVAKNNRKSYFGLRWYSVSSWTTGVLCGMNLLTSTSGAASISSSVFLWSEASLCCQHLEEIWIGCGSCVVLSQTLTPGWHSVKADFTLFQNKSWIFHLIVEVLTLWFRVWHCNFLPHLKLQSLLHVQ